MYDLNKKVCQQLLKDGRVLAPFLGVSPAIMVYVFIQARAAGAATGRELKAELERAKKEYLDECRQAMTVKI